MVYHGVMFRFVKVVVDLDVIFERGNMLGW